jgi:transcriptional regulator with XRE-family HTH domain
MVDKNALKSAMIAKGYTSDALAEKIGISKQSMSYKLNNKRPFRSNEISQIAHILELSPEQLMQIFFAKNVVSETTKETE